MSSNNNKTISVFSAHKRIMAAAVCRRRRRKIRNEIEIIIIRKSHQTISKVSNMRTLIMRMPFMHSIDDIRMSSQLVFHSLKNIRKTSSFSLLNIHLVEPGQKTWLFCHGPRPKGLLPRPENPEFSDMLLLRWCS